jgi:integrase
MTIAAARNTSGYDGDPVRRIKLLLRTFSAASQHPLVQPGPAGDLVTPWRVTEELARLEKVANGHVEAWPELDDEVAKILGLKDSNDPAVARARRTVARGFFTKAWNAEQARLASAFEAHGKELRLGLLHKKKTVLQPVPVPVSKPASISLRQLFDDWRASKPVNEKEDGRLEHQIRRLIEFVGNKPANYLTKDEVREFMSLVARFPGRKRSAELNALPIRELVESFEANNAAIEQRNATRGPGDALEPIPGTLKVATVDEWFAGYRQMYDYAVAMLDFEFNPFESVRKFVVKGAPPTKRREFSPSEIAQIFNAPLFNGFEGSGKRGYRNVPGATIVRDAKYWLPILALFHAGRLSEFAAMPLADVKTTTSGVSYFDLTERALKNEGSQRVIPIHPQVIGLGFLKYVQRVRDDGGTWLFPDLDHTSKHGAGHAFSKWWGHWMDAHGLCDPAITHHSWRHTWKRAARASSVKEEMHDVISGHKGRTVSRRYGEGADIEPLAREMARISFPSFPALPVEVSSSTC